MCSIAEAQVISKAIRPLAVADFSVTVQVVSFKAAWIRTGALRPTLEINKSKLRLRRNG